MAPGPLRKRPAASQTTASDPASGARKRPAATTKASATTTPPLSRPAAADPAGPGEGGDAAWALQRFGGEFREGGLAAYGRMAGDGPRVSAYRAAIARAVPGKRVLDVGTGPEALLAVMCARAGAAHVLALEIVPEVAEMARKAVALLGLGDQIEVVCGFSHSAALPAVDMVVHEIVGNIASEEGVARALQDLQARPSVVDSSSPCWSLPRVIETLVAPVSLNVALPVGSCTTNAGFPRSTALPFIPPRSTLLGAPSAMEVVDAAGPVQLQQQRELRWTVEADEATFTGFACGPRLTLDDSCVLDAWAEQTHWRHVLVLLEQPTSVRAGDVVVLRVEADLRSLPVAHTFSASLQRASGGGAAEHLGDIRSQLR